eukprot:2258457-Prymnesium_polylepis.2
MANARTAVAAVMSASQRRPPMQARQAQAPLREESQDAKQHSPRAPPSRSYSHPSGRTQAVRRRTRWDVYPLYLPCQ